MATILKFETRRARPPCSPAAAAGARAAGGEIVIFPGVRIERHDFRFSDRLGPSTSDGPGARRRQRQTTGE